MGLKRDLLRKFDPESTDDPENKQYFIEKLVTHEFDARANEYSYQVKWLGYGPHFDLLLPEPEIPAQVVAEYWHEALSQTHLREDYAARKKFEKRFPEKIRHKVKTSVETTTQSDNEGIVVDRDTLNLAKNELLVPLEASLKVGQTPVWASH